MRAISTSNYKVLLYDSIQDIPAERDSMVNYFLLEDSGIGTDIRAVDSHLAAVSIAVQNNNQKDALQAIRNLNGSIRMQLQNYRPDHIAWACLIYSINGKSLEEFIVDESNGIRAIDDLPAVVKMLSSDGLTSGELEFTLDEVKKKFPESWEYTSPPGQDQIEEMPFSEDISSTK